MESTKGGYTEVRRVTIETTDREPVEEINVTNDADAAVRTDKSTLLFVKKRKEKKKKSYKNYNGCRINSERCSSDRRLLINNSKV